MNINKKNLFAWTGLMVLFTFLMACEKTEKPVYQIPIPISSSYYVYNATTWHIVVEATPRDTNMPVLVLEVAPLTESYFFRAQANTAANVKPSAVFSDLLIYTLS